MDEATVHERRWWALAVLAGSLLVITLDNTILNVAIPSLVDDLDASTSELQWIIDGYVIVFAGLLLTAGALGDRFGRKGMLQIGLALFGVTSLWASVADSPNELIVARAVMGVGGAMIMPSTLSLLTNIFRDAKERGRAIGVWAAVAGASGALGPVLGGLLLRWFGWGSVFLVNVPIIIAALVAGKFLLPSSKAPNAPRLDPVGAALSVAGLVAVLFAVIETPVKGWTDPVVLASFGIGAVVLAAFVLWELRVSEPMLDMRFFANPRFTAANTAITLVFFAMFGQMFIMTQYLQIVLGYEPLEAGLRMLPMSIVMLVTAPLAPRIVERVGTKLVVGSGLTIVAVAVFILSTIPVADGYPRVLLGVIILAFGMALTMAPATESIMGSLPPAKAGVGSAMNDTTRQMGAALGVAVLGSVLAASYRPAVEDGLGALGVGEPAVGAALDSVGGGAQVASQLPAEAGARVADVVFAAYVDGAHLAMRVGAVVVLVAAAVVFAFLPARARDPREALEGPIDGLASLTWAEAEGALEHDAALDQGLIGADDDVRYAEVHASEPPAAETDPARRGAER